MGWLRRVRSPELWVIPSHPRQAPPPAHYAPRDGISGGPRGTVSQRPCGVMPAWPFVFYCLTGKIGTLGERPLLAQFRLRYSITFDWRASKQTFVRLTVPSCAM